jgi:hypothetical protein
MGILKRLLTDYPWYELVPDQEHRVIAGGEFTAERLRHVPAAVSADGRFALLYVPHEMRVCVNMDVIARGPVTARWFNPRNGAYQFVGEVPNEGVQHFVTPAQDRDPDYVLVLEGRTAGG